MSLVEDSYYDHQEHGRVQLIGVGETTVLFALEETTVINGIETPIGRREPIDAFESKAEPADITISPPPAEIDADTQTIQ